MSLVSHVMLAIRLPLQPHRWSEYRLRCLGRLIGAEIKELDARRVWFHETGPERLVISFEDRAAGALVGAAVVPC